MEDNYPPLFSCAFKWILSKEPSHNISLSKRLKICSTMLNKCTTVLPLNKSHEGLGCFCEFGFYFCANYLYNLSVHNLPSKEGLHVSIWVFVENKKAEFLNIISSEYHGEIRIISSVPHALFTA
jgi:hypothetical protein